MRDYNRLTMEPAEVERVAIRAALPLLFNGHAGTLAAMRDSVVTVIVWPSAVGGCAVLEWAPRRFSEGWHHGPA